MEEPPVAGRPPNFSGAVGAKVSVQTQAAPRELQAEEPLTFTVRITGSTALDQVVRPSLKGIPAFTRSFHIDDLAERRLAEQRAVEFDYRLRPRSAGVREIPRLPFVFFKPGIVPEHLGFQTTYAPAIPLTVKPRAEVRPTDIQGTGEQSPIPDRFYALADVVLDREPTLPPSPLMLALLFAVPPAGCAAWYVAWSRRHPDAARQARQRRSRAARQALRALDRARIDGDPTAVLGIVAEYLTQRFDLAPAEPTPAEIASHLRRMELSADLAEEAARLFRAADAARFTPGGTTLATDWKADARALIDRLEAASCSAHAS
jgi:hypothetical protein